MIAILKHRIPVYVTVLLVVLSLLGFLVFSNHSSGSTELLAASSSAQPSANPTVKIKRLGGYNFIAPLMFVDNPSKAESLNLLQQKIVTYVEGKKLSKDIIDCSFYLKNAMNTDWTGLKEEEKYLPGSLLKVPILISYLRLEEEGKPGVLNQQIHYTAPFNDGLDPVYVTKKLEPGKNYTVKELLKYMIAYSDNNATTLLDQNLDTRIFNKTLTDLGLPMPEPGAKHYPVSAKDYSLFMRAIFNASYLTIAHSEYAAELLSTSDFKDGFEKGFPPDTKMIHKFGESGNQIEHQLSESGIVYVNNTPYILTIMTKGADLKKLSETIGDISGIIYQSVAGK